MLIVANFSPPPLLSLWRMKLDQQQASRQATPNLPPGLSSGEGEGEGEGGAEQLTRDEERKKEAAASFSREEMEMRKLY